MTAGEVELTNIRMTNGAEPQAHANPAFTDDASERPSKGSPPPEYDDVSLAVESDDEEDNWFTMHVAVVQDMTHAFYVENKKTMWTIFKIVLVLLYFAYFLYVMIKKFGDEQSIRLLWCTCFVVFCVLVSFFWKKLGKTIIRGTKKCWAPIQRNSVMVSWIVIGCIFFIVFVFIIVDVVVISKKPYNLVSLIGMATYIFTFFIFSKNPKKVQWRAVAWGLGLQFIFALFILRWDKGFAAFTWLGDRVAEFLLFTDAGSRFIFGNGFEEHFFAFKILPTVIFFSTMISILYYLGAMQVLIRNIAWVMQSVMGTTAGESLNAAANIFIGQTEAPLVIRPIISDMTKSELHAVMTGGFATIAGGVLASYIHFGVPANHLISASVMSAPAALAMAKLLYPECEKSKTTVSDLQTLQKSPERNVIEAASAGASASIKLVANMAANLIAFIALLEFMNTLLSWFGERAGVEGFTFQFICSYVLWPTAFIMGTERADCFKVARMIGIKTFFNEYLAYEDLGSLVKNKDLFNAHLHSSGNWTFSKDDIILFNSGQNDTHPGETVILDGGILSDRSIAIATYALCGFANIGSIGIQLGGLGAMAPHRKSDLASVAVRAMIAGNVACFMTACIAGLLYQGE